MKRRIGRRRFRTRRNQDVPLEQLVVRLATERLSRHMPHLSSARPPPGWQVVALFVALGCLPGVAIVDHAAARAVAEFAFLLPFLGLSIWRLAALFGTRVPPRARRLRGEDLPSYSVLVPLVDEAAALPGLVAALDRLDYPRDRLEILLLLEERDAATRAAAARLVLPPWFKVLVVPDRPPRTKPKALAFGLYVARGEIIAVYDAEDTPEPLQLQRAAARLVADPRLGCVQASLVIHNARAGWFARHFALEYRALFSGLLPRLEAWGAPVPLGGTSNHFPRSTLIAVGGWDPYNVTEDADLGIRLHRFGYRVGMVASFTTEEAPTTLSTWLPQRTRWMKGWMQTWSAHMRNPFRLIEDSGWRGFILLQIILGAPLLAALVHPLFYLVALIDMASGSIWSVPNSVPGQVLWALSLFNFFAGYLASIVLTCVLASRTGFRIRSADIVGIPIYWLLISLATWRALMQLIIDPHRWEKTPHSPRPR